MQSDEDRDKFTAAVMLGEHAGSVKDLINLAQNLDCYWIYPTVRSEADYGYYLIDELDELAKIMGNMTRDAFYQLDDKNFAQYIEEP